MPGSKRGLKSRHSRADDRARGGVIGTGLFVDIGGGARSSHCSRYVFIAVLVCTGAHLFAVPRFVSRSFGCVRPSARSCGTYVFTVSGPAPPRSTQLVLGYWDMPLHDGVWSGSPTVVLCSFLPRVRGTGRSKFWFASSTKGNRASSALLVLSTVLFLRRPAADRSGSRTGISLRLPSPVHTGGGCRVVGCHNNDHYLTLSVYAFAFAPELLVATSGELESPRSKHTSGYQEIILLSSSAPRLPPWAIGIREAGISVLDDVVNGIIALPAWSAANSCMYLSSRSLYSMAIAGNAPDIFTRRTRSGVPIYAAAIPAMAALLAFMNIGVGAATVFQCYLRFRSACEYQNVTDLAYRSRFQPYTAWFSGVTLFVLMFLNGMSVFIPRQWNTSSFLTSYIGIPILIAIYAGHKLTVDRDESWLIPLGEIDLKTGLGEIFTNDKSPLPSEKWYDKWRVLFE
ncbi:putative proline-specific permease [Biscogniauxia mediterranea]|nr:putative proline-specific permease [Biscogniauxia mediterranea]